MNAEREMIPGDQSREGSSIVLAADPREISGEVCAQLAEAGQALGSLCRETDPVFIQTGRALRAVAGETHELTATIRMAAGLINGGQGGTLGRLEQLVNSVLAKLSHDRAEIGRDLDQVRGLILQISDCTRINDIIDRISASFRAVRINIRIQCSAQLISDDMFRDVTDDIDTLSTTLTQITKQIKSDLANAAKNLATLERTVSANLLAAERVSVAARGVVTRAHGDIRQLLMGTETMIREASRRYEVIAGKVDEIVISVQFHDSLSQRTNHILHAFADITRLCTPGDAGPDPASLGSAFLILDLQHRQLTHLIGEITSVHDQIRQSFAVIGAEVKGLNSILLDTQFKAVGPEQFLGSLYTSLRVALRQLMELAGQGEEMIARIDEAAVQTRGVASRLMEIMGDVREMRDNTRLQAVNTIIMASNLGERGRTIQVLAKEISALSDQTTDLVDDVEVMQLAVSHKVEQLCRNWKKDDGAISRKDLEKEINGIDDSYQEVVRSVGVVSAQINSSAGQIDRVQGGLRFIQYLQEELRTVAERVAQTRDLLLPWRDQAHSDSEEMAQLIKRYTMEQERLIHMFDRAEAEEIRQENEEVFF